MSTKFHVVFIDFADAFGSVKHPYMFETLQELGIPYSLLRVIEDIYKYSTFKVICKEVGVSLHVRDGEAYVLLNGEYHKGNVKKVLYDHILVKRVAKAKTLNMQGNFWKELITRCRTQFSIIGI